MNIDVLQIWFITLSRTVHYGLYHKSSFSSLLALSDSLIRFIYLFTWLIDLFHILSILWCFTYTVLIIVSIHCLHTEWGVGDAIIVIGYCIIECIVTPDGNWLLYASCQSALGWCQDQLNSCPVCYGNWPGSLWIVCVWMWCDWVSLIRLIYLFKYLQYFIMKPS